MRGNRLIPSPQPHSISSSSAERAKCRRSRPTQSDVLVWASNRPGPIAHARVSAGHPSLPQGDVLVMPPRGMIRLYPRPLAAFNTARRTRFRVTRARYSAGA